jgi:hypothetical protein
MTWISVTESADLRAVWAVLETAAATGGESTLQVRPSGFKVSSGDVLVAIDSLAHRHLLLPLSTGEAFAEDRGGRGVQLRRADLEQRAYADVVCLLPELNTIFERLCREMLSSVAADTDSPARALAEVLGRWKTLLATASAAGLGNEQLMGLIAELLCLELIVAADPLRRVDVWTGPSKNQHDFRRGDTALEVKATAVREGRVVSISSVDQLEPPTGGRLFLAVHRLQPTTSENGLTLPRLVGRIRKLGVDTQEFDRRLTAAGYHPIHDAEYGQRGFQLVDKRFYDTASTNFPSIRRRSFVTGDVPAGTLRLSYSIDLTNEPPSPLSDVEADALTGSLAGAAE